MTERVKWCILRAVSSSIDMITNKNKKIFSLIVTTFVLGGMVIPGLNVNAETSITSSVPKFDCTTAEASIPSDAAMVTISGSQYYIGTHQATSINQNPVISKFTGGVQDWCRDDYEQTSVDGRGLGLLSTSTGALYAFFTVDGGSNSFNFGTGSGWLTGYGSGGGAKVSVLSRIDTTNGGATDGTFIRAELSSGNTNTLEITNMVYDAVNDQIQVQAESFFSPLDTSKNRITVSGDSPFDYVVVFSADLTTATSAYLGTISGGTAGAGNSPTTSTENTINLVRSGGELFKKYSTAIILFVLIQAGILSIGAFRKSRLEFVHKDGMDI